MEERLLRILAIVKTDVLIRLRKPATLVIFLLLCILSYNFVPDPATGHTLIQSDGHRGFYNSALVAVGTGMLGTFILGFFGFYLVSNALRRDIQSRTGFVIASTAVANWEYLLGKLLGNIVFLSVVMAAFMGSSMGMQVLRGEVALEPFVFIWHYLWIAPSMIVFVSVVAMLFESIPFLSGKIGDVAYFFVWLFTTVIAPIGMANYKTGQPLPWTLYVDTYGLGFVVAQIQNTFHTSSFSIGSAPYNTKLAPMVFSGFTIGWQYVLPRLCSILIPLLLMGLVALIFHRFNPTRLKLSAHSGGQKLLARLNGWMKPVADVPLSLLERIQFGAGPNFGNSILADVTTTFRLAPLALLVPLGFSLVAAMQPAAQIQKLLPPLMVATAAVIADVAAREKRAGLSLLTFASPFLKPRFIVWKLATAVTLTLLCIAVPLAKLAVFQPHAALSFVIGSLVVAAAATALGTVTGSSKAFLCSFMLFWYIALDSKGRNPALDFAGWFGTATLRIQLAYATTALALIVATQVFYLWRERRG
ncbi:MAG: hypothetical protein K1Y36_02170 [Blastocatellia bacterium]|nr:hypothetical protein [Blastocatellia bacterium]